MYTIGLIEDDNNTALIHTKNLKQLIEDCKVTRFLNGEEAITALKSGLDEIDIFLVDFNLQSTMTGLDTVMKMQELYEQNKIQREYPSIIYTVQDLSLMKNEVEYATMAQIPFINKPVRKDQWKSFILTLNSQLLLSKDKRKREDNEKEIRNIKKTLIENIEKQEKFNERQLEFNKSYVISSDEQKAFNKKMMEKLESIEISANKPLHEKAIQSFNHYMNSKNIMTRFFVKLFTKMFLAICLLLGMLYSSGTFDIIKFIKGK